MRIFWKFFLATFISFFAATMLFSVAVYLRQSAEAERLVVDEIASTSRFLTGELSVRGSRSEWPFESLITLGERSDVLFWWVVREDGVIHLASDAKFMNTDASHQYPDLIEGDGEKSVLFRRDNYGVFAKHFLVNGQRWQWVIGFSLKGVADTRRAIILWETAYLGGALVIMTLLVWLMIRNMVRPLGKLSAGVARFGRGDMTHRVPVESGDEVGELAREFNVMADRLEDVYQNLEDKVNERTKELEANRVEFISVATHQLKTPITALKWGTETLEEKSVGLSDDMRELITDMRKAADGMADLVNALLNVSRLELGTYAVILEPVDLERELRAVIKMLNSEISRKRLKLNVRIGTSLPALYDADRQLAIIIFQNLLSNAVKYSFDDGAVDVYLDKIESGIILRVGDHGVGIPEAQQARLFTKLFRADNVQQIEGTGLGLFVVKSIVESVGGRIDFTSKDGAGTIFTVVLPGDGMPARAGTRRLT